MKDPISRKQNGQKLRKTLDIDLWHPQTYSHVSMLVYAGMHMHLYLLVVVTILSVHMGEES